MELIAAQGAFEELCVAHADAAEAAPEVIERLSTAYPRERLLICQAGAAVTTHLGLGAVGVCGVLYEDFPLPGFPNQLVRETREIAVIPELVGS